MVLTLSQLFIVAVMQQIKWTNKNLNELRRKKTGLSSGSPTRLDINQTVQPQKMARGVKFWILEVEGLYYLCTKNKDADLLPCYRAADLRLVLHICEKQVFS